MLALAIGSRTRVVAQVDVTSRGLLAIGALVSSILLATAVIVTVSTRAVSVRGGAGRRAVRRSART